MLQVKKEIIGNNKKIGVKKIMNKNTRKPIPSATLQVCFHGESWYRCPHCNQGVEAYQWKSTNIREVSICPHCGNKAVVGYYGLYYEDDC